MNSYETTSFTEKQNCLNANCLNIFDVVILVSTTIVKCTLSIHHRV